jgi:hypothetical protein
MTKVCEDLRSHYGEYVNCGLLGYDAKYRLHLQS